MPTARAGVVLLALLVVACAGPAPSPAPRVIPPPPPMPAAQIPPGGRPADLTTAYGGACTYAVFSEVPARIRGVQRVQADGASLTEFPADDSKVTMTGTGRYYVDGQAWQPFEFRCTFDQARVAITDFTVRTL